MCYIAIDDIVDVIVEAIDAIKHCGSTAQDMLSFSFFWKCAV